MDRQQRVADDRQDRREREQREHQEKREEKRDLAQGERDAKLFAHLNRERGGNGSNLRIRSIKTFTSDMHSHKGHRE